MEKKYQLKNRIYLLEDPSIEGLVKNARESVEWIERCGFSDDEDCRLKEQGLMILLYWENSTNRESGNANDGLRTFYFN